MTKGTYSTYPGLYGPQTRRNLWLPDALLPVLKRMARKKGISYSELVRQILIDHVRDLTDATPIQGKSNGQ